MILKTAKSVRNEKVQYLSKKEEQKCYVLKKVISKNEKAFESKNLLNIAKMVKIISKKLMQQKVY